MNRDRSFEDPDEVRELKFVTLLICKGREFLQGKTRRQESDWANEPEGLRERKEEGEDRRGQIGSTHSWGSGYLGDIQGMYWD